MRTFREKRALVTLARFMVGVVVVVSILVFIGTKYRQFWGNASLEDFTRLDQIFRKNGMEGFKEHKQALRESVRHALSNDASTFGAHAENIAVYLFPELLPNQDLEKEEASEGWGTLEEEIEDAPNSPEARLHLEEMKANIWNYENADRSAPHLSDEAAQVIRIYQAISSPREGT